MTPLKIIFNVRARRSARDGTVNEAAVEMPIRKELADTWRLVQERVLSTEEVAFDQRRRNPSSTSQPKSPLNSF